MCVSALKIINQKELFTALAAFACLQMEYLSPLFFTSNLPLIHQNSSCFQYQKLALANWFLYWHTRHTFLNIIITMRKLFVVILLVVAVLGCTDPNCISCVADPTVCKTCRPGYRATLGKCDPCDEPHCANCNESESYCSTCLEGYRANGGHCEPCPQPHCAKCLLPSACTACLDGYRLTINGCVAKSPAPTPTIRIQ